MHRKIEGDDIVRWPDGSWCYHSELHDYGWKSDDYEVLPQGSPEWELLVGEMWPPVGATA